MISVKEELGKCKICGEEYKYKSLKKHIECKHKIDIKQYAYEYYNIPINNSREMFVTILYLHDKLKQEYPEYELRDILKKLYDEQNSYSNLNNLMNMKCNEHLLYLKIRPKIQFSKEHKENLSKGHENTEQNKILKEQKIIEERKNNKRLICKICGKEYNVSGIGYHIKTKHNIEVKDYLKKYYDIPYSKIDFKEITFVDIPIIIELRKKYPQFNDVELFQYLYDKNSNYRELKKIYNYDIGKICMCLGIIPDFSLPNEVKTTISKTMTGRKLTIQHKLHLKNAYYNLSEETRKEMGKKISKANIGRRHTKESIRKMIENRPQVHTYRGKGGIREDIGHFVRSTWEANYARILQYLNVEYEYEKEIIWLKRNDGSEISYRPDFKIKNLYVEVKGY